MLILITYDLKKLDKDYAPLYEAIKKCGSAWWHYMESVWIVKTELSPNDCFERIVPEVLYTGCLLFTLFNNYCFSTS